MAVDLMVAIQKRRIELYSQEQDAKRHEEAERKLRERKTNEFLDAWVEYIVQTEGVYTRQIWSAEIVDSISTRTVFSVSLVLERHPEISPIHRFSGVIIPYQIVHLHGQAIWTADEEIVVNRFNSEYLWGVGDTLFEKLVDAVIYALDFSGVAKSHAESRPSDVPLASRKIPDLS